MTWAIEKTDLMDGFGVPGVVDMATSAKGPAPVVLQQPAPANKVPTKSALKSSVPHARDPKKQGGVTIEERSEEERHRDLDRPPPSPYEQLESVWALSTPDEQRIRVAQIFHMPGETAAGVCAEAIALDDLYYDLLFARESGFNTEQTKVFVSIMKTVKEKVVAAADIELAAAGGGGGGTGSGDASNQLDEAMDTFKQLVLAHSVIARAPTAATTAAAAANGLVRPSSQQPSIGGSRPTSSQANELVLPQAPNAAAAEPTGLVQSLALPNATANTTATTASATAGSAPQSPSTKTTAAAAGDAKSPAAGGAASDAKAKKKDSKSGEVKAGGNTKRDSARAAAAEKAAAEAEAEAAREAAEKAAREAAAAAALIPPPPARVFLPAQIQVITDYAVSGIFSHYSLYQCVFNPRVFSQHTNVHTELIRLDVIPPEPFPFSLSDESVVDVDRRERHNKWTADIKARADADAAAAAAQQASNAAAEELKRPPSPGNKKSKSNGLYRNQPRDKRDALTAETDCLLYVMM